MTTIVFTMWLLIALFAPMFAAVLFVRHVALIDDVTLFTLDGETHKAFKAGEIGLNIAVPMPKLAPVLPFHVWQVVSNPGVVQ